MPDGKDFISYSDIYQRVRDNHAGLSLEQFNTYMADPAKSKSLFDSIKKSPNAKDIPDTYDAFLDHYDLKKKAPSTDQKKVGQTMLEGEQPASSSFLRRRPYVQQGKSLPPDLTPNLTPVGNATQPQVTKSDEDSAYKQAVDDTKLHIKKNEFFDSYYNNNYLGLANQANPKQMLSGDEWERLGYEGTVKQVRAAFMSNPSYLDKKNRDDYYNSLPKVISPETVDNIKQAGEDASKFQLAYNFHRDLASKNPTAENVAALGMYQAQSGDLMTSMKTFRHVVETNPNSPQGYQGLAYLSYINHNIPQALTFITEGVKKNPTDLGLQVRGSNYLWLMGKSQDAMNMVSAVIESAPYGTKESMEAYQLRSAMLSQLGSHTSAAQDNDKAIQSQKEYNKLLQRASGVESTERFTVNNGQIQKEEVEAPVQEVEEAKKAENESDEEYNQRLLKAKEQKEAQDIIDQTKDMMLSTPGNFGINHDPTGIVGLVAHPLDFTIHYLNNLRDSFKQGVSNITDGMNSIVWDVTPQGMIQAATEGQGEVKDVLHKELTDAMKVVTGGLQVSSVPFGVTPAGAIWNTAMESLPENMQNPVTSWVKPTTEEGKFGTQMIDQGIQLAAMALLHRGGTKIANSLSGDRIETPKTELATEPERPVTPPSNEPAVPTEEQDEVGSDVRERLMKQNWGIMDQGRIRAQFALDQLGKSGALDQAHMQRIQESILNGKALTTQDLTTTVNQFKRAASTPEEIGNLKDIVTVLKAGGGNNIFWKNVSAHLNNFSEQVSKASSVDNPTDKGNISITLSPKEAGRISLPDALKYPVADVRHAVLNYFAGNGKIKGDEITRVLGFAKDSKEYQSLSSVIGDDGLPTDRIVEKILTDNNLPEHLSDQATSEIENVLQGHLNKKSIQESLRNHVEDLQEKIPDQGKTFTAQGNGKNVSFHDENGNRVLSPNIISRLKKAYDNATQVTQKGPVNIKEEIGPGNDVVNFTVNPINFGDYEQARRNSAKIVYGKEINRQEPITEMVKGNEQDTYFSHDQKEKTHYALIPADKVQEQHIYGKPNHKSFLVDAMPMNRYMENYGFRAEGGFDPSLIIDTDNAHFGPPVVNERGEVIQGNGRTSITKENLTSEYYDHIKSLSKVTGISAAEIDSNPGSMLVKVSDVTDKRAIELGQKTTLDLKPDDKNDIASNNLLQTLPKKDSAISRFLDKYNMTLEDVLSKKGREFMDAVVEDGLLDPHDANLVLTPDRKALNTKGMDAMLEVLRNAVGDGANPHFQEALASLPDHLRLGVDNSILKLVKHWDTPNTLLPQLQNAILFYSEYLKNPGVPLEQFANQADEYGMHPNMTPYEMGFVKLMHGAPSASVLPSFIDHYDLLLKGNEASGISPLSKYQALNELFGNDQPISELDKSDNLLHQPYENTKEETTTPQGNTSNEVAHYETKPSGTSAGQNAGQAPPITIPEPKDIIQRGLRYVGDEDLNDMKTDIPITENSLLGIGAGMFKWMNQKFNLELMRPLHMIDNANYEKTGSKRVLKQRIADTWDALKFHYPGIDAPENMEAVDRYRDAVDVNRYNEKKIELPALTDMQQKLYDALNEMDRKGDVLIDKALSVNGLSEGAAAIIGDSKGYQHREVLDYSDQGDKIKEMERNQVEAARFKAGLKSYKETAGDIFDKVTNSVGGSFTRHLKNLTAAGMKVPELDDMLTQRKVYKVVDASGNFNIIKFEDDGKVTRYDNKKPSYFGIYKGTREQLASRNFFVNPSISDIKKAREITDANGKKWRFQEATKEEIMKHTSIKYDINPFLSTARRLVALNDTYENSRLYHFVRYSDEFRPYMKVLDPNQLKGMEELEKRYNDPLASKEDIRNETKKLGLPDDFLETHARAPKGSLPEQFDNAWFDKKSLTPILEALTARPVNSEHATRALMNLLVYSKILGLGHAGNILTSATENVMNLEALKLIGTKIKEGRLPFGEYAKMAAQSTFRGDEFHRQLESLGVNLLYRENREWGDMTEEFTTNHVAHDTEFQNFIEDLEGKEQWDRRLIANGSDKVLATANWMREALQKAEKVSAWLPQDINTKSTILREFERQGGDLSKGLENVKWEDPEVKNKLRKAVSIANDKLVTYRMPTYVLAPNAMGRLLSKAMNNKNISIFAGYNYGKLKVLKNDVVNLLSAGVKSSPEQKRLATDALQRWVTRGLLLYGATWLEHELNKDRDSKEYTKVRLSGDLSNVHDTYDLVRLEMNPINYAKKVIHQSPIIGDVYSVWNNMDAYSGKKIYNDNGNVIQSAGDIISYAVGGGNIFNAIAHIPHDTWPQVKKDLISFTGATTSSHYSPYEFKVIQDLRNYKDYYENQMYMAEKKAIENPDDAGAIKKWMNTMYDAQKDIVGTDIRYTREHLDNLKNGVFTPTDAKQNDAILFWEKHLSAIEGIDATNKNEMEEHNLKNAQEQSKQARLVYKFIYESYHPKE